MPITQSTLSQESTMSKRSAVTTRTVAKRLRRVEFLAARNKAEMKMQDFNVAGAVADGAIASVMELSAIAEGAGANERHGNKIRIHRVEIRGNLGSDNADGYLIQCHTTTVPSYGSFSAYMGGHTTVDTSNTQFSEWRYLNGKYFKDHNGIRQGFKYGYTAKYNAALSTSCVDNRLVFVVKNDTGAQIDVEIHGRVWYTDA